MSDDVKSVVIERVAIVSGYPKDEITPDTRLDSISVDSLDTIELCCDLECHYDINLPDDSLFACVTVGQVIGLVEELIAKECAK